MDQLSEDQFYTLLDNDYLFWCSGLEFWLKREEFKFEYQEIKQKRAEYLAQTESANKPEEPKTLFKIRA